MVMPYCQIAILPDCMISSADSAAGQVVSFIIYDYKY